jgi:hypothetical protein
MQQLALALAAVAALISTPGRAAPDPLPVLYGGLVPTGQVAADNQLTRPRSRPRGWVLVIHGGSWIASGSQYLERGRARWYNRHGWGAYDIDYRPGELGLVDVAAAYDRLRQVARGLPVCADGASAGAHLALMLAAVRPLSCVVGEGAPVDLGVDLPPLRAAVQRIFSLRAWLWSPPSWAGLQRGVRMLLAYSSLDPTSAQITEARRAWPGCLCMVLPGSRSAKAIAGAPSPGTNFVHASVTSAGRRFFDHSVARLIQSVAK